MLSELSSNRVFNLFLNRLLIITILLFLLLRWLFFDIELIYVGHWEFVSTDIDWYLDSLSVQRLQPLLELCAYIWINRILFVIVGFLKPFRWLFCFIWICFLNKNFFLLWSQRLWRRQLLIILNSLDLFQSVMIFPWSCISISVIIFSLIVFLDFKFFLQLHHFLFSFYFL